MHELRSILRKNGVVYSNKHKKPQLIEAIIDPEYKLPQVDSAPKKEKKVFVPLDKEEFVDRKTFEETMIEVADILKKAKDREQALLSRIAQIEGAPQVPSNGETITAKDVLKAFVDSGRTTVTEFGYATPESVSPDDTLPEPAIFWSRSPQYSRSSLRIGPVPEALPRGQKMISFRRVIGPVTLRDPENNGLHRNTFLLKYETSDRVMAEKLRKDAEYGVLFFESISDIYTVDSHGEEYRRAYEGHRTTLRTNSDPNYPFRLAKEEGIPFDMNTSPDKLINLIAAKYAERDAQEKLQGLKRMADERSRQMSLMKSDGVVVPQ